MTRAGTPQLEEQRLGALYEYGILDSDTDPVFDGITMLATHIAATPIALISLVDRDRQWFKSRVGLDVSETDRESSFCAHAVYCESFLEVEDTATDPRFSTNPLVLGPPHIRFYAGAPLRTGDGFVLGTLCVIDRVPRRLTAEQRQSLELLAAQAMRLLELRRQERLLTIEQAALVTHRRFFELTLDLQCTIDRNLVFGELNPAWEAVLGWTRDELRSRPLPEWIHPDDRARTLDEAARMMRHHDGTANFENRYLHKDGRWIPLAWVASVADGICFGTARDVSAYQARQAEITEREARLRALFDGMVEGVVMQNQGGAIVTCNAAAEQLLGLTRAQMMGVTSVDPRWAAVREDGSPYPGDDHPSMITLRTGEPITGGILGIRKPNGQRAWLSVNTRPLVRPGEAAPYAVIATFRDVTAERAAAQLAARTLRQERLITTGTLAAGVGHEINSPLAYALTNIDLALEEARRIAAAVPAIPMHALTESLRDAREGAERIRGILRGLRALVRADGAPVPTAVAPIVDTAIDMAMHELRPRATVVKALAPTPSVLADESRLTQVLVNLLINAAQAFTTSDASVNQVVIRSQTIGDQLELAITDNGPGIAPDVLPRIYDPFFTTRPVGQGVGLGLSICHNIVTTLDGQLTCESELGRGTTFRVRLPLAPAVLVEPPPPKASREPRGRVLIVDDDPTVLRALTRSLQAEHVVVAKEDPRAALALIEAGEWFDVVFCDLMMPHMTGRDLFQRVHETAPAQADRFVFISGGVLQDELTQFLEQVPNERLEKPFSLQNMRGIARRFVETPRGF
ncbi:MAG: PAS domain S-box protein [Deltaproteobacteria bacterium]|nr:PAS domain S-box protein [Deltaproteobacteria bacterium]